VRLTVIGCSPAWPNPGGAQSGYLLEAGGKRLLLDCGPGVLARMRERESWPQVDAIAITHFHLDHWGDLVPWVWGSMYLFGVEQQFPELWVHHGGRTILEEFGVRFGFPDMFDRVFSVREFGDDGPFAAAGFTVEPIRLPHYRVETYGFRVTADGATLAYSGDSAPAPALGDLAREADLFLCEATLVHGDADGEPRGHLSADEALDAFESSGASRLLLTHRPAELPLDVGLEQVAEGDVVEVLVSDLPV
jgi:ribonuclease BN (tRNA processing enzyme)